MHAESVYKLWKRKNGMPQRTGTVNLPLHPGKCPRWLFSRMVKLGGAISEAIIYEYGQEEYLKRISDPYFFQAFSCALAFDWHSSGTTTTTLGALKLALNPREHGIKVTGGKGAASRKTPYEIEEVSDLFSLSEQKIKKLKYTSKMVAKVDNSLIQCDPPYKLYHHSFVLIQNGKWCVVQQGINTQNRYARRYHWLSDDVQNFVEEPHNAICCDKTEEKVLNLTARESRETRETSLDLVKDNPKHLEKYFLPKGQKSLTSYTTLFMGKNHYNLNLSKRSLKFLKEAYEFQPSNYEELVALKGMGHKTIRALALISELVYGTKPSWQDPAKFSFAHGGKDNIPRPVDKQLMDSNTEFLKEAVKSARIGDKEKLHAIKRLGDFVI